MPYDLEAPARLLYPSYSSYAKTVKADSVPVGTLGAEGIIRRFSYPDGKTTYQLKVECESMSHPCPECDCGTAHYVNITDEQVTALRKLLEK